MKHKLPMYYGAAMELFKFAEKMRFNPTIGEKAMWDLLKSDELCHYKFRRQHPIATFIADFYSHQLRMVIEIDGEYHLDNFQKEYVQFIAENKEIIGETIEIWTRPFGGMPAEFWKVPVNKPVWGPRYLAEQIKRCYYLVIKTNAQ